uniref:Collagenase NC10/endostatin domain-containing protein n=1 Tax=Oncorhynchus tshawytscha TaxID=74940 RepID=A0A8C8EI14_ONCTS
ISAISIPGPPGPPGPPGTDGHSSGVSLSYDTMTATARRQAEGTLVYLVDQTDFYIRVRDGFRQIQPQPAPVPQNPVYSDTRYPVTPQRRPRPPETPSHQHTSGPSIHLVALNAPQGGNMRGIRGADFLCFNQARAIGLKGTFRAFLSSKLQDLYSIVRKSDRDRMPIVNLKDEVLFDSWEAIFSDSEGRVKDNVPIYSFDGKDIFTDGPDKMIWHGSTSRGHGQVDNYCETWRIGERGQLLQQRTSSCHSSYAVLCIENSYIGQFKR